MTLLSYAASAALLADGNAAENFGRLIGLLLFPIIGIILLVIGLHDRSKSRRAQPPYQSPVPGYPPYPPYAGGFPPPGYPPAPPPRPTAGRGLIVGGSILIAISLIGVVIRAAMAAGDPSAAENVTPPVKVGQCITGEAMASGAIGAHDITECTNPAGVFEVVSTGGRDAACPDGAKSDTDFARWTNNASTVCFIPNLLVDHCYATVQGQPTPGDPNRTDTLRSVLCTEKSAEFKVLQRYEMADYNLCPTGAHQRIWTVPPRTYCTGPPR